MIEVLTLALVSSQIDAPPAPAPCPYGIEHFIGSWHADLTDEANENDTSVIEFSNQSGTRTWRQYLHYRQLDEGRWLTSQECGTVTLLSPTSSLIVARFKVTGKDQLQLERSGQIYTRANTARPMHDTQNQR